MNVDEDCSRCGGGGSVIGYRQVRTHCPECSGTGKILPRPTGKQRFSIVERKGKRNHDG